MTETKTSEATRKSLLGDKETKRTLRAADYLAVRHALPKTYLHHAILHENVSQDRHYGMNMNRIQRRQHKFVNSHDLARRTFLDQQSKKHRKWKRDDATRASNMNFPTLRPNDVTTTTEEVSTSNPEVIYRSPRYLETEDEDNLVNGQLLPYMSIHREATQLVKKSDMIYMTKLPSVVKINDLKLRRYNTYCGTDLIHHGARDTRHTAMLQALSSRKATPADPVRGAWIPPLTRAETNLIRSKRHENKEFRGQLRAKVIFPSLTKRLVENATSDEAENDLDLLAGGSSRRETGRDGNVSLHELLKSYGKLPTTMNTPRKRRELRAEGGDSEEVEKGENAETRKTEDEETESEDREFKSPGLQLMFTVKSNMK